MIAVYVNENGEVADLTQKGSVVIYTRSENGWSPLREIIFDYNSNGGLAHARVLMIELVGKLEGCKVFVARKVAGQLYYILEANGFESFEAEGSPYEILDSVNEAVKAKIYEKKIQETLEPEAYYQNTNQEGGYQLNLKEALNRNHALTSKRLLLPFLRAKNFKELEVICDHPPGWLDKELKTLELKSETVKRKENEYKIIIIAG